MVAGRVGEPCCGPPRESACANGRILSPGDPVRTNDPMTISFRNQPRLAGLAMRALAIATALLLATVAAQAERLRPGPETLVATFDAGSIPAPPGGVVLRPVRVCGTDAPSADDVQSIQTTLARWRDENMSVTPGGTIHVAVHVITARGEGNVSDAQLGDLLLALNRDYTASGYRFELSSIDRTEESGWFHMTPGSGKEKKAKQMLAVDPARHLNLYVCALGQNLLGWASLPWAEPEDHYLQGVVIDPAAVTAVAAHGIASHEVAHYLGLLPAEGVEASPALGGDQIERMRAIVPVYRPSLFTAPRPAGADATPEISPSAGAEPEDGRVLSFRGSFPNPFHAETAIRFTLPASQGVSLRIYSVTGQLVRILVDATLPAGDHSAMFRADGLPSGAYFAVLRAGSVSMSRTLMLVR